MRGILLRITTLTTAVGVLIVLIVCGALEWQSMRASAEDLARAQAESVVDVVATTTDADAVQAAIARTTAGAHGNLAVHLGAGITIGATHITDAELTAARGGRTQITASTTDGRVLLLLVPSPTGTATVELFVPTYQTLGPFLDRLAVMIGAGLVAILAAAVIGEIRSRPLVGSVRTIASAAAVLGQDHETITIPSPGARELLDLVNALNNLSHHIDKLVAGEREFVADMSHRLRTPLTALRLDSEALGDSVVAERVRNAVSTLEGDVDNLIRNVERATEPAPQSCDLAKVVGERMTFWSVLADHQGRPCELQYSAGPTHVDLPDSDIGAVIDSLVGNIFRHTPPQTPFAASVVCHAGWVRLVIEDGGPGIADVNAALRRGMSSRGSTGLGLDIARHAVEATGGTIHIDRGRLGGARIRLRFAQSGTRPTATAPKAWRLWSRSTQLP